MRITLQVQHTFDVEEREKRRELLLELLRVIEVNTCQPTV
jgi:hypothetical protein